jgi:DNA-3-methyladenine glycosylase II
MVEDSIKHLKKSDPFIKPLIPLAALYELREPNSLFQALSRSIIGQQLSVKVAAVIWSRFLDLFPANELTPSEILSQSDETLRSIGLSGSKSQYIKNVAVYFQDTRPVDFNWGKLSDAEILTELTQIKGVGEWTVQMLLLFTLRRTDIWPVKDLGIQQSFAKYFNFDEKGKGLIDLMNETSERWRPHRSAVSLALWKWKDLGYPPLKSHK